MSILDWQPYVIAAIGGIASPCLVEYIKRIHEDARAVESRESAARTEIAALQKQLHDQEIDWRDRLEVKSRECEELREKHYALLSKRHYPKSDTTHAAPPHESQVDGITQTAIDGGATPGQIKSAMDADIA